ncbi:MAG: XdhC family protein [Desulfomonile tiedjei]|uniref:XdhC family protein n=1 Tax=Desulfomonile tiedjei TaxID=2358 RepID=A0A9D6Z5P5_9BACT|nr:XdhC family protein [Desulfomonile tiedjei]
MLEIWKAAVEQFHHGNDFALATILAVRGSSPRHVGTRFLVRRNGSIVGTIGGGLFEAQVQQFAWDALKSGISHRALFSFQGKDAESAEMICGGDAEVLVEFVPAGDNAREQIFRQLMEISRKRASAYLFTDLEIPIGGSGGQVNHLLLDDQGVKYGGFPSDEAAIRAMPQQRLLRPAQLVEVPGTGNHVFLEWLHPMGTVFIFGAGHVGACVAHLAAYVDFKVVAVDDRSEFACPENVPDADQIVVLDSFKTGFEKLEVNGDSYLVIVTRGHAHDKTVLEQALRTPAGYIGMIGSRRKIKLILESLLEQGFGREDIQRVHAPIGLPIGGETPEEIGVSIIAEMVQIRNRKDRITQLGG